MKFAIEPSDKSKTIYIIGLILIAFLFSLAIRLTWVYHMNGQESMRWNDEFMVTTNDSYYFAEGAKDLIYCDRDNESMGAYYQQNCHQEFDLSPVNESLTKLTHAIYDTFNLFGQTLSLETIIFYLPAFAASLIVIPIILVGRRLHLLLASFITALIASIGTSYYSRTMVGYYDTDMLNILFPMLLVWSLSLALKTRDKSYLLLTGLEIVCYRWWYPQSYSIEFAFFALVLLYVLVYERRSIFHYQLLSIMLVGMAGLPDIARFAGVILLYLVTFKKSFDKFSLYILVGCVILFFIAGGLTPIIERLNMFIFSRDGVDLASGEIALNFFSVTQTIVEAQTIDFADIATKAGGHIILFAIGIIGYILLCIRQPIMLIMLPLLGLGLLAKWGGLRFVMYAIPVIAFGIGFFIFKITEIIHEYTDKKVAAICSAIFACVFSVIALYPLVENAWGYRTGTVFIKEEVSLIENFGKSVDRDDYVITWWDYGYPIRYYADTKTLVDGAKHTGDVNFPVSFALSHDQTSAANLARLDVEYTEKRAVIERDNENKSDADKIKIPSNNAAWMMKDYGFTNSNDFIVSLRTNIALPEKTRDIYFYLPYRMLDIYPTIMRFSHLDLMSGKDQRQPFFFISRQFKDSGALLELGGGYAINKQQSHLIVPRNEQTFPLKRFVQAGYQGDGAFHKNVQNLRFDGAYSLIHLQAYNVFLVVDEEMYNSVYVQLFYLENYDPNLFELVAGNPYGKFFKLKI